MRGVLGIVAAAALACGEVCTCEAITVIGQANEDPVALRDLWYPGCAWVGEVEYVNDPFMCGDRGPAWGCYEPARCPERITVARGSGALWHELGHACGALPFD